MSYYSHDESQQFVDEQINSIYMRLSLLDIETRSISRANAQSVLFELQGINADLDTLIVHSSNKDLNWSRHAATIESMHRILTSIETRARKARIPQLLRVAVLAADMILKLIRVFNSAISIHDSIENMQGNRYDNLPSRKFNPAYLPPVPDADSENDARIVIAHLPRAVAFINDRNRKLPKMPTRRTGIFGPKRDVITDQEYSEVFDEVLQRLRSAEYEGLTMSARLDLLTEFLVQKIGIMERSVRQGFLVKTHDSAKLAEKGSDANVATCLKLLTNRLDVAIRQLGSRKSGR